MKSHCVVGLCMCFLFAGLASATDWTGAIDELWSNPDNWSNGLPTPATAQTRILLPDSMCLLDRPAEMKTANVGGHLRLVEGADLNAIAGYIYIGWTANQVGLMEVMGGVVNTQFNTAVGNFGNGTLVIDYSGVFNQNDQYLAIGGKASGVGRVELRGGLLNIPSTWEYSLRFAPIAGGTASMDLSGGTLMQPFSDARLTNINDNIANGTITAYGERDDVNDFHVIVDTGEDNEYIKVSGLHPFKPVPTDGSNVNNGPLTIEWTVAAGTQVDVWFSDDPQKIFNADPTALVIDKQTVSSVQVTAEKDKRYFWAVDTYAAGATEPSYGPLFDFFAENVAPEVDAGDDVTTWLTEGRVDVTLAGIVLDADPTTTLWTIVSQPDDTNSADAVIHEPTALDTTLTCSALGEYVLQLEANDGEKTSSDTLSINVYDNGCLAAQSLPEYEPLVGDINGDCIVDDLDLAILEENWLKSSCILCPDPNTP